MEKAKEMQVFYIVGTKFLASRHVSRNPEVIETELHAFDHLGWKAVVVPFGRADIR